MIFEVGVGFFCGFAGIGVDPAIDADLFFRFTPLKPAKS